MTAQDVCTFDCMQNLYAEFCGGAVCVHGVNTLEQQESLCSDKCLNVLFGRAANLCLERNLPVGADTYNIQEFLMGEINSNHAGFSFRSESFDVDFCFGVAEPSREAPSSEEAYYENLYNLQALDLVDPDF